MRETSAVHEDLDDIRKHAAGTRNSDPAAARKKAMDYLARREHSREELVRKMKKAGFDCNVALDVIEQLRKDGLQSDRRFVEAFVQSRISHGKGPRIIRADLSQRGVREPVIHEALVEVTADWVQLARQTRLKKFGEALPDDFKEKARQMRFLQSRGFEPDQIQAAVRDVDD